MIQRVLTVIAVAAALTAGVAVPALAQVPVRIGGEVKEPKKVKDAKPLYPEEARREGVQGIVILEVVVNEEGKVTNTRVLRAPALLEQAAVDAVQQWEYTPTLLNGLPVPVVMTVTVTFSLDRSAAPSRSDQPADIPAILDYAKAVHSRGLLAETEASLQRALAAVQSERSRLAVQNANVITMKAPLPPPAVRVGGSVKEPKRLNRVMPSFPPGTPAGISIIEIVIGVDGRVTDARVLRPLSPDADAAALAAVRQWIYEPTYLNGVAVPVVMTVTVTRSIG